VPVRASTYQYAPRFLLYQRGSEFDMVPDHILEHAIKVRLPVHLRQGWGLLARNTMSPQSERDTEEVASWISVHGAEQGFRVPNVRERGRAMGMMAYLNELELGEQELYDAQGNSFDPQAVLIRLQSGVLGWARGDVVARHEYPMAAAVRDAYSAVLGYVRGRGLQGAEHPYPHDLREWLLGLEAVAQLSQTPSAEHILSDAQRAAEHGRGDQ